MKLKCAVNKSTQNTNYTGISTTSFSIITEITIVPYTCIWFTFIQNSFHDYFSFDRRWRLVNHQRAVCLSLKRYVYSAITVKFKPVVA